MRARRTSIALVGLVALAACGGTPDQSSPSDHKDDKSTLPSVHAGTVMPGALGEAHCALDANGIWEANGTVKNTTTEKLSLDVQIHIGPADGKAGPAHLQRVEGVEPGKDAAWAVPNVTAEDPAGPCQIQVVAAK